VLVEATGATDGEPLWIAVSELVLGGAFLLAAAFVWRRRRRRDPTRTPAWLAAVDRLTPSRSAGLGAVLSGANPKNLALALGAAIALAEADLGGARTTASVVLFVAMGTVGIALPLMIYLLAPERSSAVLGRFRAWLGHHDAALLTLLGLAIGAKFVYDGLSALS
jgi:hypothetical protein